MESNNPGGADVPFLVGWGLTCNIDTIEGQTKLTVAASKIDVIDPVIAEKCKGECFAEHVAVNGGHINPDQAFHVKDAKESCPQS